MKFWLVPIGIIALIAAFAFGARISGDDHWGRRDSEVITTQSGETVIIRNGHGPGFPKGIVFVPLIIFGLFWAHGGRQGRGHSGPWGCSEPNRSQWLNDWHRSEHEKMVYGGNPASSAQLPTASLPGHSVKSALVVEDDRQIARLIQDYLERAGFSVETTIDGDAALA